MLSSIKRMMRGIKKLGGIQVHKVINDCVVHDKVKSDSSGLQCVQVCKRESFTVCKLFTLEKSLCEISLNTFIFVLILQRR